MAVLDSHPSRISLLLPARLCLREAAKSVQFSHLGLKLNTEVLFEKTSFLRLDVVTSACHSALLRLEREAHELEANLSYTGRP